MAGATTGKRIGGWCGHAACAGFLGTFGLLWAVHDGALSGRAAALALCLLPSLALASILLDLFDAASEVRDRLRRRREPGAARFARTRIAGIVAGKAMCWTVVPLILAVAIPTLWREAAGDVVTMPSIQVLPNGRELYVEGDIGRGFASRLEAAFAQNPGIRSVTLDSDGGLSAEGIAARAVIAARGISTFVEVRCHSACVDAYLGGVRREAAPGAAFALHHPGVEFAGVRLGSGGGGGEGFLDGLPDRFRQRVLATPFGSEWHPTRAELLEAGVVHGFVEGGGHALTPHPGWKEPAAAYAALVRPALVVEPTRGEAGEVRAAVRDAAAAMWSGEPRGAFRARMGNRAGRLALLRAAGADDGRAKALAELVVEALAEAGERGDEAACGRLGLPDLRLLHGIGLARGERPTRVSAILAAEAPGGRPAPPGTAPAPGGGSCRALAEAYRADLDAPDGAGRLRARYRAAAEALDGRPRG